MSTKLTTLAVAGLLSLCTAAPALAGSVTQPGETVGIAAGAPLPPGFYYVNTMDLGCRDREPALPKVCSALTIPVVAWSTPVTLLGARLQFLVATPAVLVAVEHTDSFWGIYNPLVASQLAWDLGNGWGFSYLFGAYLDVNTNVAFSSTSINQRFALSYTNDGWNLTANVIWGIHLDSVTDRPQLSPCPTTFPLGCNPNFVNVDLTATKKVGKWEFGPVAFGSTDLNRPVAAYQKQSQFAVGGFIGYDFGSVILQSYLTTDVVENNYGGRDIRGWARVILPLGKLFEEPAPAPITRKY
jgi:hypothetical protein